jgi:hypothetical protein
LNLVLIFKLGPIIKKNGLFTCTFFLKEDAISAIELRSYTVTTFRVHKYRSIFKGNSRQMSADETAGNYTVRRQAKIRVSVFVNCFPKLTNSCSQRCLSQPLDC